MTVTRRREATIEFPNELEVVITRDFDAPIQLVYDVFTKTEHLLKTLAPFGEEMKECTFDVRVGGEYRYVFVADDGTDMVFHGTYLEVEPPNRTVETWLFDGWPDVNAVETIDLSETDGVTTMQWSLVFSDMAGRSHMTRFHGVMANFDNVENYLKSLQEA